jgi:hypothetical protein
MIWPMRPLGNIEILSSFASSLKTVSGSAAVSFVRMRIEARSTRLSRSRILMSQNSIVWQLLGSFHGGRRAKMCAGREETILMILRLLPGRPRGERPGEGHAISVLWASKPSVSTSGWVDRNRLQAQSEFGDFTAGKSVLSYPSYR